MFLSSVNVNIHITISGTGIIYAGFLRVVIHLCIIPGNVLVLKVADSYLWSRMALPR